jgi:hypothetical protein
MAMSKTVDLGPGQLNFVRQQYGHAVSQLVDFSIVLSCVSPQLARAIVTTAGVGVTAGYVLIRGF